MGGDLLRPERKNGLYRLLPNFGIQIKIVNLIEDEPEPDRVGYFEGGHMATEAFELYMALHETPPRGVHSWTGDGQVPNGFCFNTHILEPAQ